MHDIYKCSILKVRESSMLCRHWKTRAKGYGRLHIVSILEWSSQIRRNWFRTFTSSINTRFMELWRSIRQWIGHQKKVSLWYTQSAVLDSNSSVGVFRNLSKFFRSIRPVTKDVLAPPSEERYMRVQDNTNNNNPFWFEECSKVFGSSWVSTWSNRGGQTYQLSLKHSIQRDSSCWNNGGARLWGSTHTRVLGWIINIPTISETQG
jgi:hypothetical protein